ncbi:F-box domain-containing protein [Favolaschia claudopus]|uniref:F-box domain-containing protein n=1 Tax=Favolaschia claudopus TaxID=2862362 RepID=A0AAV9ZCS8_9AGAR
MIASLESDRTFVAHKAAQILELENQIDVLERSIDVLRVAQKPAQDRLDSYKYPVLTLPPEIISEIFLHFLPTYPEAPGLLDNPSPTNLTHVCRHWRAIAIATPALWRSIDLRHDEAHAEAVNTLCPLWLERSGNLPLSFFATDNDLFPAFLSSVPHRARWEHLELSLLDADELKAINGPMPLLYTLTLFFRRKPEPRVPFDLQHLSLLRVVTLDDHGSPSVILPWSQLTSLTLRSMRSDSCMSILSQTLNLVDCTLSLWGRDAPIKNQDLALSHLKTLVFEPSSQPSHTDSDFFRLFITPSLRRLELPEALLGSRKPITSLRSFILRCGCTLNELRITEGFSSEYAYRNAFSSIPTIRFIAEQVYSNDSEG